MFDDKNHAHAMATAFGSLGGFATAARSWWTEASKNARFNSLLLPFSSGKVEVLLIWATTRRRYRIHNRCKNDVFHECRSHRRCCPSRTSRTN